MFYPQSLLRSPEVPCQVRRKGVETQASLTLHPLLILGFHNKGESHKAATTQVTVAGCLKVAATVVLNYLQLSVVISPCKSRPWLQWPRPWGVLPLAQIQVARTPSPLQQNQVNRRRRFKLLRPHSQSRPVRVLHSLVLHPHPLRLPLFLALNPHPIQVPRPSALRLQTSRQPHPPAHHLVRATAVQRLLPPPPHSRTTRWG